MEIIGAGLIIFGVFFSALGVLGLLRLPDVYSRLHASGKVSTLGLFGLLAGSAFLLPSSTLKSFALAIFMIIVAPVTSHAIARSVRRAENGEREDDKSPSQGGETESTPASPVSQPLPESIA